jgi:uncharacterized membrane protein YoaK (UPF0700 family)
MDAIAPSWVAGVRRTIPHPSAGAKRAGPILGRAWQGASRGYACAVLPPARLRDLLLIALALVTGATDATAFERLGHVFASVITGNLVLIGISAVQGDGTAALLAGTALAAYAAGVSLTAPSRHSSAGPAPLWPAAATVRLGAEGALLAVFAGGWELAPAHPGTSTQALLLAAAAGAMGMQSTAVRRLGQISTTYLTSTLTGVFESLARLRWPAGQGRSVGILCSALAGAAAGTEIVASARAWLPALQLIPLVLVVLAARGLAGITADE